jgi:hypothetical protein
MTKTEQKILDHLSIYRTFSACRYYGHGPEGGRVRGGGREFDACLKLVNRGLAIQLGDIYRHVEYRSGYGVHCAEVSIRLPATEG